MKQEQVDYSERMRNFFEHMYDGVHTAQDLRDKYPDILPEVQS